MPLHILLSMEIGLIWMHQELRCQGLHGPDHRHAQGPRRWRQDPHRHVGRHKVGAADLIWIRFVQLIEPSTIRHKPQWWGFF